jgi:isoquinoline 1-oxidoreductase beta subunit
MTTNANAASATRFTRRHFLKSGAAASASLMIGFYFPARAAAESTAAANFAPNAFVEISPNGETRLWVTRSEMGQGVRTSMIMILAEELDVDMSSVKIEQANFDPKYGDMTTGGSASVRSSWDPLRKAGSAARDMLLSAAAETWKVPKDECTTDGHGSIEHKKTQHRAGYGDFVAKAAALPVPKDPPLKDPKDYRIVGKKTNRVDGAHIVIGEAHYGIDTRVPGMLYAVVERPPVPGGRVKSFDASKALAMPGVRKVFEVQPVEMSSLFGEERAPNSGHQHYLWGGVAVVADSTWQAMAARRAVKIEWNDGPGAAESTESHRADCATMLKSPGKELKKIGDPEGALAGAEKTISAEYELPFVAHATMEPPNCTAVVSNGKCEVWAPTQNANGLAASLASVLGIPASALTIHVTLIGGGFGRRLNVDYGIEAALVARAAEAPVKVIWTREDDIRHDYYRPMSCHKMRAGLDAQNHVTSWTHHIAAPATDSTYLGGEIPDTGGTEIAGTGLPNGTVPNYRLEQSFLHTSLLRGYWRSVDMYWNHFALQTFIDEIAAATGKDPLALRHELIDVKEKASGESDNEGDAPVDVARLKHVLDLAAEKSSWGTPLPAGRGRGIAGLYGFGSYLAHVAEVTVAKDGTVRVERMVTVVDCGQVINPDMVAAQVEGGVAFALTAALYSNIVIEKGRVQQSNFNNYPMLRISDMPRVEVHLVPSHEAPGGMGEPSVPSVAPAVGNAIFAATGKRLRRLPFQTQELAQS